jgi:hypothetical protein
VTITTYVCVQIKFGVVLLFRFITPQAARAILPIFKREITEPYITWPAYKKQGKDLKKVYERWQECNFKFACSEENVKASFEEYVERRFPDWMSSIRNSIFAKHKSAAARYVNCAKGINRNVWPKLVEKWLDSTWQVNITIFFKVLLGLLC